MPGQFIDAPEPPKTTGQFIDTPPPPSQGGFRTLPGSTFPTRQIDLGNGKTSEQRQDGLVWFGPAQGNTGKPGWFNAQGLRGGDMPGKPTSLMDSFANELVTERNKRAALPLLGQIVPGQISGMAKGLVNNIVGPAQLAAHALGSSAVDPVAQGIEETYRKNWQQSPTGEMVGQAIPFLMTGGGTGAAQTPGMLSSLANIGKAGVTGAAFAPALTPETNLQGSPDFWARKRQEALLGGVLGAVPAAAGELGGAVLSKFRRPLVPEAQAVQDLGEQFGVRTLAPDLAANKPGMAKAAVLAESIPGSGMVAQRVAQQQEAQAAAAKLLEQHGIEGDVATTIQSGLANKLAQGKAAAKAAYDKVGQLSEGLGNVPLDDTLKAIQEAKAREASAVVPDQGLVGLLDKMEARLKDPAVDTTYNGTRGLRSDLGSMISDYYKGTNAATGSKGVNVLQGIKGALESDMGNFTSQNGPEIAQAAKHADSIYKNQVVPFKDRVIATAVKNSEPDQIYNAIVAKGPDRAQKFYNALDDNGQAAVRAKMVQDAYSSATKKEGVFSPAEFAKSLEGIKDATGVFFKGKDKFELDGFTNLMRHIQRAGQVNENPPTGQRVLIGLLTGEAAHGLGAMVGHGPEAFGAALTTGAATVGGARGLTKLFSSPAGKALLLGASELPAGSPQLDALITKQLPKVLGVSASNVTKFQAPPVPLAAQIPQNPTEANMESR